ncbi:prolyl oligopeptidase family serine peptidase [Chitinophaga pendula]|uniref:alpha/beta hydrolase family protein n=1 Tax=Chitinophaga TaxID=79328 RepID=UPI000BB0402D|nr:MULTISPECIES: prolyl oligopeptidase family serine peptidase [Chitinophaga]ASZ11796.1 peptidase S9 [Chitinophaga sp. MD30]UCJ05184.1 prolyl oligopeptidase family serine peptidase [Chitinophaga pendula]
MRLSLLGLAFLGLYSYSYAQKKPLDHTVYDSWQSIGAKMISNDGRWSVYTITPQEGDAQLVIHNNKSGQQNTFSRAQAPLITQDSRFVLYTIKPAFADTREARIKKKKPAEMPKDSLGIINLETLANGASALTVVPNVKSFKAPAKGSGIIAYLLEIPADTTKGAKPAPAKAPAAATSDDKGADAKENGILVINNLSRQQVDTFKAVSDYIISKPGNKLLIEITPEKKDATLRDALLIWDVASRKIDTLSRGKAERKQLTFDEEGLQAAWVASRDSAKAPIHYYALNYYKTGQDSGHIVADKNTQGLFKGWNVSDNGNLFFSKNGQRLFFGTAPIPAPKDTTIVDFEVAKVDIWHYQDDYLQPMQLKNADRETKRTFLAAYTPDTRRFVQLADTSLESITLPADNNSNYVLGSSDRNNRVQIQWVGRTLKSAYLINLQDGSRKLIRDTLDGRYLISPAGQYILWYDMAARHWFTYNVTNGTTLNISKNIPTAMFDEEDDHPDLPGEYGIAGWLQNDQFVYIYDRYDIWKVDPSGKQTPEMITQGLGRREQLRFRNIRLDEEERFFKPSQTLLLETFQETSKYNGFYTTGVTGKPKPPHKILLEPFSYSEPVKAKNTTAYLFTKADYKHSPDLYTGASLDKSTQISHINPQQQQYNWGTAELFKWTAYNGKPAEGILYKPEDFDASKKYPVLLYFYEKLSDALYSYQPPAPTPSRLNISFFVSRGYLVLAPDITYEDGHPGQGAYDYIVSGARALAQNNWADSSRMGIQGQSWGGYQVAYLITRTPLFRAAWAGAPVANMTSAYGGIRWESGMNRQFQYEHSQSRIGATLWEKPELYIENSPLFHLPAVQTPLAIMANDADGAVPWYQGIELFTGLRRLGKPVWMLNYNNEAHNLVQRQNRKDIQRREQQFFDHFLKDEPAPQWLKTGVPATEKGKNWGW